MSEQHLTWRTEVLGETSGPSQVGTTGNGRTVFWIEPAGDRLRWHIDGKTGEPFDTVWPRQDGHPYIVGGGGDRFAMTCSRGNDLFILTDRGEGPTFHDFTRSVPPVFAPDGRMAYGAGTSKGFRLFVDDREAGSAELAPVPARFSPDGGRLAWAEMDPATGEQWVVLDGDPGPRFPTGISTAPLGMQFSPDGRRFAYFGVDGARGRFVVDGRPEIDIDDAIAAEFSPDSRRFVYLARRWGRGCAVVDGKPEEQFAQMGTFAFSPDSRRLAYAGRDKEGWRYVLDGALTPPLAELDAAGFAFSPDSRRTAYRGTSRGKGLLGRFRSKGNLVIDGVMTEFDEVTSKPHFSPDSRQLAYSVKQAGRGLLLVDGDTIADAHDVGPPRWTADGRVAWVEALDANFAWVVLGGVQGPALATATFMYLGDDEYAPFMLTPDGHVAYAGFDEVEGHVFVDHQPSVAVDGVDNAVYWEPGRLVFVASHERRVLRLTCTYPSGTAS